MIKLCLPFCCLFFVMLFTSCGPNYIFEETTTIENQAWTYQDTIDFKAEITDTLRIFNLYLYIEHAVDYSHQNVYIQIYTLFPSGQRTKERISIDFADKTGQWYGDCDNEWCQLRIPIQEGAFFNAIGMHTFTIEQYMRVDPLQGIKSISMKIEETKNSR